jgi:amino acid transporter
VTSSNSGSGEKLGFQATWSMAVGGMVGGGIFSTLGVVIGISGRLAWLSFVAAGLIAMLAGYSYAGLAKRFGEGGGAFTFLREIDAYSFAGSLAWILIVGYVLTNAVYAFTFGEYVNHVLGLGPLGARAAAVIILLVFIGVNLLGTGEAGGVEVFLVWFKLAVLMGLAGVGIARWNPELLSRGVPDATVPDAVFGAAAVFMAYEGFQLLTYDYEDIRDADRTLPRAILSAIAVVIFVYVAVALGTAMLIGADQIVANQEVALSIAGQNAFGTAGLVVVTIAAAFSTGSAINATLFATARLSHDVARAGELPSVVEHRNREGVPDRAVITLGLLAALFASIGSLSSLVESASLAFLFTFCVVCAVAYRERVGSRWLTGAGAGGAGAATLALVVRLSRTAPVALALFAGIVVLVLVGRPLILRHVDTDS